MVCRGEVRLIVPGWLGCWACEVLTCGSCFFYCRPNIADGVRGEAGGLREVRNQLRREAVGNMARPATLALAGGRWRCLVIDWPPPNARGPIERSQMCGGPQMKVFTLRAEADFDAIAAFAGRNFNVKVSDTRRRFVLLGVSCQAGLDVITYQTPRCTHCPALEARVKFWIGAEGYITHLRED